MKDWVREVIGVPSTVYSLRVKQGEKNSIFFLALL